MPLPLLLAGAAIATVGAGIKKGYDGYQDKSKADNIVKASKERYEAAQEKLNQRNKLTSQTLEKLGELQLSIGQSFYEFQKLADELIGKINESSTQEIKVHIPSYKLQKIEGLALSATSYAGKLVGAGAAGGTAAYAVYGGVLALGAASTGTPIAALSGIAAKNAALAAIGGGSLASGGLGIAGGTMILGATVAAPVLAVAGIAFASYAKDALKNAKELEVKTREAVEKMATARHKLEQVDKVATKVHTHTNNLYETFKGYFDDLKAIDTIVRRNSIDPASIQDNMMQIIENGYSLAAILTDVITTPLFKPVMNDGEIAVDGSGAPKIMVDPDGYQVLNRHALDEVLDTAQDAYQLHKLPA
ncbi:chemotaxis protein [Moraxella caviae]|uniref:Chemotaxis protein n=1 Tax=Moraxella caviae TaxID=34060 RepID=A0A1T0A532_9GAMM|nr:chemotaxis protein [Moraxella caviae]OOR90846.1 chemotaxis protein [Moraxella caviae]STZ10681.1 Uncharacterised protein [Moraxella caviae]